MSEQDAPAWAAKLGADGWRTMCDVVGAALTRRGAEAGPGPWTEPRLLVRSAGRVLEVDLAEWAGVLGHAPQEGWRRMVGHLVRVRLAAGDDTIDLNDFASVKDRARIRLSRQADLEGATVVSLTVMPGVEAVLAIDLPDEVVLVTPEQVTAWGIDARSALALGLHHTVMDEVPSEKLTMEDGVVLYAHTGDSPYIASRALALERWLDNRRGAFVAVPARNLLLFHPIEDERALGAVYDLWAMAQEPFRESGAQALSGDVYWWTPGRFTRVEVRVNEASQSLEANLPPELILALQSLGAEPS
ncbi:MAG TPA: hypothetical protein PKA64_02730 [Myxococcota bacterium]|nr:hypothetical protein [Myxococcota bacterium]